MKFSEEAWASIQNIYKEILNHPFNQELAKGILAKEKFQYYLKQDSLYLVDFSRALAISASKAPNPDDIVLLLHFAEGAIVAERGLHQSYFDLYEITLDVGQGPGCFAYTNFLKSTTAHQSYEIGAAALLPCFWIYREVGLEIHKNSNSENPYRKWIDTYSGKEFIDVVDQAIDWTDRVASKAGSEDLLKMKQAFIQSTQLEWMFWDCAYRLEQWNP